MKTLSRYLSTALKKQIRALLHRAGYDLVPLALVQSPAEPSSIRPSYDAERPLPFGATESLRSDHPRLRELRERYARVNLPMRATMWGGDYLERELELTRFRGDNAYVWQFRNVGAAARQKYYLYLRDLAARDTAGLLNILTEDGLFGCWTFEYPGWPRVSRDLLDSINELLFLDRHTGVLRRPGLTVLDIGAGYGRLAHRMLTAAPSLKSYLCADAVPESAFLCEYYLRFRGCADRAEVLPLDELDARLAERTLDLALSIHSFSEMGTPAIESWLSRVANGNTPWLLIVPNHADRLLTMEADGTWRDFSPLLAAHGYELAVKEPVFSDPTVREFMGVSDHFFLFHWAGRSG